MGEQAADAKASLATAIRAALPQMIKAAVDAIWSQVPAYAGSTDTKLRESATAHVAVVFEVFLAGLMQDRPPRRSDFAFTRQQASRRIGQGISLADYLQAFRVGQLTLWRGVLDAARDDPQTRLIVATATPKGAPAYQVLIQAAAAIAGAGLAALRQDEIVGVIPLSHADPSQVVAGIERACARLDQVQLAIGVSTVHTGLHEVPEAYAEAQVARDALAPAAGVLALPLLSAFDYLTLREAQTAQRLIKPEVRRFVSEDLAAGGTLITTLVTYAESDLNAKVAAQRLHLHVNTAYYRLEKIAERTGYDLRRLTDVVELLIAIRLLGAPKFMTS
ncbi:MAG TPA: helix-turn-helix domain-containing protein [Streptosporangiaceae bacterium]|nr:helix-turn-helix domain-containing protein [Streptosporangiaceae bacterium]